MGFVSEPTLVVFVAFSILSGLFIAFIERIESLSLRQLDVKLKEMREAESSVKKLAKATLEVIEASNHAIVVETFDREIQEKAIEKLRKLTS